MSAPYAVSHDALAAEQKRSAAYLEALRRIVRDADYAIGHPEYVNPLQMIRKLAANAIADNKE